MSAEPALRPGQVFAGHRIERFIAAGGMGSVYAAVDLQLEREVALKAITGDEAGDAAFRSRFVREARLLAGIDHPHVLPIYQAGEAEGLPYLTMRLVTGGSLRELLHQRHRLTAEHAVRLLAPVAGALDALHAERVLHRDVKPENILLEGAEGEESVWLADFGLARHIDDRSLTGSAEHFGTFDYMAPEQWRADGTVTARTDVYALGLILYETLAGHRLDLLERNPPPELPADAPAMAFPAVGRRLYEVCLRALEREAERRYPSAGALVDAARTAAGMGAGGVPAPGSGPVTPPATPPPMPMPPPAAVPPYGPAPAGTPQGGPYAPAAPGTPYGGPAGAPPGTPPGPPAGLPRGTPSGGAPPDVTARLPGTPWPPPGRGSGMPPAGGPFPDPPGGPPQGWPTDGHARRAPARTWAIVAAVAAAVIAVPVTVVALRDDPAPAAGPAPSPSVSVVTRTATPRVSPSGRRARPNPEATRKPARSRGPANTTAPQQPAGTRLTVCAETVRVREDPLPEDQTRVVGTLRRGESFVATGSNRSGWVFGRSAGPPAVTGWVLRQFVKTRCS